VDERATSSSYERTFGPPQHPILANPVNHRNIRILPPELTSDFTLFWELLSGYLPL
jgi:E3 ubiquitin-protein ligase RNF38/44